jgi:hypothetical protein
MPITPITLDRSCPNSHQRQQRAEAGRRQRRQDGQRVDEALIEHAQHDIDAPSKLVCSGGLPIRSPSVDALDRLAQSTRRAPG